MFEITRHGVFQHMNRFILCITPFGVVQQAISDVFQIRPLSRIVKYYKSDLLYSAFNDRVLRHDLLLSQYVL